MDHAYFPVGVSGKPTELHLMYPVLAMTYTKYPQACKALMAFMLEADNFNPWIQSAKGYLTHCLNAYDKNPVWTADPKATPFRDVAKRTLTAGGLGSVGEKAATASRCSRSRESSRLQGSEFVACVGVAQMSDTSSLSELARFVGQSALASEDAVVRRQAVNAMVTRFNPGLKRRGVGDLLGVVMALSARTRRMLMPHVQIELDVFSPDGLRAVRVRLPKRA